MNPYSLAIVLATLLSLVSVPPSLAAPAIGAPQPVFAVSNTVGVDPTDEDLRLLTVFNDRLVPMGGEVVEGENAALAGALSLFQQRVDPEDVSMLQACLAAHPASRWNASLLLNLGLQCYEWGYLSLALQHLEGAWQLAAPESDSARRAIADRAVGELLVLNARLGRREEAEQLLLDIAERPLEGSVALDVQSAKEGLTRMRLQPEIGFKCGPFALNSILNHQNGTPNLRHEVIEAAESTPQGTNLLQVRDWAAAVGLDYQVAKKEASGQVITPAVMHWRLGHFAALLSERDGRYLIQDATFGGHEMYLTARAIEAETDGYFLVPAGPLPVGWRTVSDEEAATVWGKGGAAGRDPEANGCKGGCGGGSPGMPWADYYLMRASSNIQDVPLYYDPPIGPRVSFDLNYNQDEPGSPEINTHANLGSNWDFNWISYLEVDAHYTARVRLRSGGTETFYFSLFNNATNSYPADAYSQAVLKWTTDAQGRDVYRREMSDGSAEVYSQAGQPGTVGRYYLKQIVDPQGNAITINYEVYPGGTTINYTDPPTSGQYTNPNVTNPKWTGRINEIVDAAGNVTSIRYLSNATSHAGFRKIRNIIDPYGRVVLFTYNGTVASPGRLVGITDAIGMTSTFSYASDGFIEVMNTPYGKTLFHRYNQAGSFTLRNPGDTNEEGQLITVNDFMRGLRVTYPNGSTAVVESWLGSYMRTYHWNTLLSKRYPLEPQSGNPTQYSNCEIYRWRMKAGGNVLSAIPYSFKAPLQEETLFSYEGSDEVVVEDEENEEVTHAYTGTTNQPTATKYHGQTYSAAYNVLGNITQSSDPLGRVTKLYYDGNGVDLLELRRVNGGAEDLLAKLLYNDRHLPFKIFDAAGHATELEYNAYGQVTSSKDALSNITTYGYFEQLGANNVLAHDSLLEFVDGPLPGHEDKVSFTYDDFQRVKTVTDPEGFTTHYTYDELNRTTKIIHQPPGVALADSEYEEVIYDRLSPVLIRDRQGRWTKREYDSMGWMVAETDPEGRRIELDWCICGSLNKLTDAKNQITRWEYDDLGRLEKKIRADGREEVLQYYPGRNRLHHVTTAGETRRVYTYTNDESIATVTYQRRVPESDPPQFVNDPDTPAVSYAYDSVHDRTTSVSSSVGSISYQYHPYRQSAQAAVLLGAGALSRVETSVLNGTDPAAAILYQYDALGRTSSRSIQSFINNEWTDDNHSVAWQYDAISRLTTMTNVLGEFGYTYDQPAKGLSRLASVTYPNGQVTSYDWHPAAQHRRLAAITHRKADTTLISSYGYQFAKGGQLRTWTQQVGADPLEHWQIEHDEAEQLRSVIAREGGPTGSVLRQQFYNYDPAGNRTGYQDGHSVRALAYNHLNQITSQPTGGPVRFEGTIDEPGTVSINEQSATMRTVLDANEDPTFRFAADVQLSTGLNQVTIEATDGSSNTTSELYEVSVTELTGQSAPSYDTLGNMTSNGRGQTYEWDALNQLLAIEYADDSRTEFTYDALSRRVRILEKDGQGATVTDKRLLWEGTDIVQERDASNTVVKRYATHGLSLADDSTYFYTSDHLGSIRQVTDEDETVVEDYLYDAYGIQIASTPGGPNSTRLADFRYTGHYHHQKSNLHLAMYRAYDSELGVWISEDPIQENGGINLYGYVANRTLTQYDPTGLGPRNFIIYDGKDKSPPPTCKWKIACRIREATL